MEGQDQAVLSDQTANAGAGNGVSAPSRSRVDLERKEAAGLFVFDRATPLLGRWRNQCCRRLWHEDKRGRIVLAAGGTSEASGGSFSLISGVGQATSGVCSVSEQVILETTA